MAGLKEHLFKVLDSSDLTSNEIRTIMSYIPDESKTKDRGANQQTVFNEKDVFDLDKFIDPSKEWAPQSSMAEVLGIDTEDLKNMLRDLVSEESAEEDGTMTDVYKKLLQYPTMSLRILHFLGCFGLKSLLNTVSGGDKIQEIAKEIVDKIKEKVGDSSDPSELLDALRNGEIHVFNMQEAIEALSPSDEALFKLYVVSGDDFSLKEAYKLIYPHIPPQIRDNEEAMEAFIEGSKKFREYLVNKSGDKK